MVASPIETWSEENSGWGQSPHPPAQHQQPKSEWGQDDGGWTPATKATAAVTMTWGTPKKEKIPINKWGTPVESNNNNTNDTQQYWGMSNSMAQQNWGAMDNNNNTTFDADGEHFGQWGVNGGNSANMANNGGTVLVISGLFGTNISGEELRTLVNFKAGGQEISYIAHVVGDAFFPYLGFNSDMAFFKMDSESAALKAKKGLEGFYVGRGGQQLHASIMPEGFGKNVSIQTGNWAVNSMPSPFGNGKHPWMNSPAPVANSSMVSRQGGDNYGEDQSEEMADNQQLAHATWKNDEDEEY